MKIVTAILKELINNYMHSQWVNYRRDIGFFAAKEELLSCAEIMFYEPRTTTPKYVFSDESLEIPFPLPVIACSDGDFVRMYLDGDYSLTVSNHMGDDLIMVTTNNP